MIKCDIAIIGGGLTALSLHYLLRNEGLQTLLIEARDRLGGRIYTNKSDPYAPIEMGATWLEEKHTYLNALLKELEIDIFPQEFGKTAIYEQNATSPHQLIALPEGGNSSYRIQGGTSKIIETLAAYINPKQVYCNEIVKSITNIGDELLLESNNNVFKAKIVISTLPPFLLKKSVTIEPLLPKTVSEVMEKTHTWMGESIKIGLRYKSPFWRAPNTSGTIFSNAGPVSELYDHSNYSDDLYALKGFLNSAYHSRSKKDRLAVVLKQLRTYYGAIVDDYIAYEELVWSNEKYTYSKYEDAIFPHQNNGHPLYRQAYLDGKLYLAGSETAVHFPGYMEGAISSAATVYNQIKKILV